VMRQVAHSSVPMAALMHSGLCPVHRGFIAIGRSPRADGAGPFAIPNPNEGAPDPSHLGIGDSPDLTKTRNRKTILPVSPRKRPSILQSSSQR
jgi:hypothetical protein